MHTYIIVDCVKLQLLVLQVCVTLTRTSRVLGQIPWRLYQTRRAQLSGNITIMDPTHTTLQRDKPTYGKYTDCAVYCIVSYFVNNGVTSLTLIVPTFTKHLGTVL